MTTHSRRSGISLAQEIALNRAIRRSIKGAEPYPGAVRRFGFRSVEDEEGR